MDWWQVILIVLTFAVIGILVGIFMSYIILRFVKHEPVAMRNLLKQPHKGKKNLLTPSADSDMKSVITNLFFEAKNNSEICTELLRKRKIIPFETCVWDEYNNVISELPLELISELDKVYGAIGVANSVASSEDSPGEGSTKLYEFYGQLSINIAQKLNRILAHLERFISELNREKFTKHQAYVSSQITPHMKWRIGLIEPVMYLIAISAAQVMSAFYVSPLGMIFNIIITVVAILRSALIDSPIYRNMLLSLTLVPLIRIITLVLPLGDIPPILIYFVSYSPVFLAAIFLVYNMGYKLQQIGVNFRRFWIQPIIAATGVAFGYIGYFIILPESIITELSWKEVWLPASILLICAGFMTEFVFHGILQSVIRRAFGWLGLIYVGVLFTVTYLGFLPAIALPFIFVIALFFSLVVVKTRSIIGVSFSFGIYNILVYLILPLMFAQ